MTLSMMSSVAALAGRAHREVPGCAQPLGRGSKPGSQHRAGGPADDRRAGRDECLRELAQIHLGWLGVPEAFASPVHADSRAFNIP